MSCWEQSSRGCRGGESTRRRLRRRLLLLPMCHRRSRMTCPETSGCRTKVAGCVTTAMPSSPSLIGVTTAATAAACSVPVARPTLCPARRATRRGRTSSGSGSATTASSAGWRRRRPLGGMWRSRRARRRRPRVRGAKSHVPPGVAAR